LVLLNVNQPWRRASCIGRGAAAAIAVGAALLVGPAFSVAEEAEASKLSMELNKLEPKDSDCRVFFLFDNKSDRAYDKLQLDFYIFRRDGIVNQSFTVDIAPLKANKKSVKRYDLSDTDCDDVGSILINEVAKCQVGSEELSDCLDVLSLSSRTEAELSK
jgi:hypothetical protein